MIVSRPGGVFTSPRGFLVCCWFNPGVCWWVVVRPGDFRMFRKSSVLRTAPLQRSKKSNENGFLTFVRNDTFCHSEERKRCENPLCRRFVENGFLTYVRNDKKSPCFQHPPLQRGKNDKEKILFYIFSCFYFYIWDFFTISV